MIDIGITVAINIAVDSAIGSAIYYTSKDGASAYA